MGMTHNKQLLHDLYKQLGMILPWGNILLLRYLSAFIYDCMILLALFMAFTAICLSLRHGIAIPPATRLYQLALAFIVMAYYFFSYRFGGQTIGMRAWRIKLIAVGTPLGTMGKKQIFMRLLLTLPACIYAIFHLKNPHALLKTWTNSKIIRVP